MRSPNNSSGFSLIELVVAVGIFAILFSLGPYIGLQLVSSHVFATDVLTLDTLVRKARSQTMHGIDGASHGVHISSNGYLFFTGDSHEHRTAALDIFFPAPTHIIRSGLSEIVFNRATGRCTAGTVTLTDGLREKIFAFNDEGQITVR